MKYPGTACMVIFFALISVLLFALPAQGEASQVTNTVTLNYMTVQLSYPSEALPGNSVTINLQAKATDNFKLLTLTVNVYYPSTNTLHLIVSETVSKDVTLRKGDQIDRAFQVTVPSDAPRTSLVALVSEKVRLTYYDYSYSYFYPYYYPYWNYSYPYYYPFFVFPAYSTYYVSVVDDGIAPLSYIKATTPEFVSLQSEYEMLQQTLTQTQAENEQLKQDLQAAKGTINDRESTIADLNRQLSSAQGLIQLLEIGIVVLVVVVAALGFMVVKRIPKQSGKMESQSEEA